MQRLNILPGVSTSMQHLRQIGRQRTSYYSKHITSQGIEVGNYMVWTSLQYSLHLLQGCISCWDQCRFWYRENLPVWTVHYCGRDKYFIVTDYLFRLESKLSEMENKYGITERWTTADRDYSDARAAHLKEKLQQLKTSMWAVAASIYWGWKQNMLVWVCYVPMSCV